MLRGRHVDRGSVPNSAPSGALFCFATGTRRDTLAEGRNREGIGRLVSRVLRPRAGPNPLAQAIAELKAEVRRAGLTDAEIDAELAAYNAERRNRHGAGGA